MDTMGKSGIQRTVMVSVRYDNNGSLSDGDKTPVKYEAKLESPV